MDRTSHGIGNLQEEEVIRPNFLIVGAPKCGTTAMWRYLGAHPEIWMCPRKDMHYFGSDLNFKRRDRFTEEEYLAFFEEAGGRAVGEASVWYLYSKKAAEEIHRFDPSMKIIVMLREPVSLMYAHYTQMRYNGLGDEDQTSFQAALDREEARAEGWDLPEGTPLPEALLYRRIATLSGQIMRYYEVFPPEQIHIVLQDDMKRDMAGTYRKTLDFLGVDPGFETDFKRVNTHKTIRSERLRSLVRATPAAFKDMLPRGMRMQFRQLMRRFNSKHGNREPLGAELKGRLREDFRDEIATLADLIGRDLGDWTSEI
jgi:hypothetical protein